MSSNNIEHAVKDLQEKSAETLSDLKDSLAELKTKVTDISQEVTRSVDDEAHRRPWMLAGFVAVFSMFFGFLLGRTTKH